MKLSREVMLLHLKVPYNHAPHFTLGCVLDQHLVLISNLFISTNQTRKCLKCEALNFAKIITIT